MFSLESFSLLSLPKTGHPILPSQCGLSACVLAVFGAREFGRTKDVLKRI
jgi:hypothetical protein